MTAKTFFLNTKEHIKERKDNIKNKLLIPLGKGLKTGFETGSLTEGIAAYKFYKEEAAKVYKNRATIGDEIREIMGAEKITMNGKTVLAYGLHMHGLDGPPNYTPGFGDGFPGYFPEFLDNLGISGRELVDLLVPSGRPEDAKVDSKTIVKDKKEALESPVSPGMKVEIHMPFYFIT